MRIDIELCLAIGRFYRFGDDNQTEIAPGIPPRFDFLTDFVEIIGDFRNENNIGAAGNASRQGDMTGIASPSLREP